MAAAAVMACAATVAHSQPVPVGPGASYPAKAVRVVVGFPPTSAADIAARVIGQRVSAALGQQIIVDNRPGAASNIAADLVSRDRKSTRLNSSH